MNDSIEKIIAYLDAVIRGEYGSMALHNSIKRTRDALAALLPATSEGGNNDDNHDYRREHDRANLER